MKVNQLALLKVIFQNLNIIIIGQHLQINMKMAATLDFKVLKKSKINFK